MTANRPITAPDWDPDTAPDLSTPEWRARFDSVPVRRGRPKARATKVSTTIRLDRDIVEAFRAGGEGWQTRINDALRAALKRDVEKKP